MAKYRHRHFEMYEFRDEAVQALTPKIEKTVSEVTAPELWIFEHLAVSRSAGVTHVQFKEPMTFGEETLSAVRKDFAQLADRLGRDSKILVDFTDVVSFSSASIDALVQLKKQLQTKGSRMVLCSLNPAVRENFFVTRSTSEIPEANTAAPGRDVR